MIQIYEHEMPKFIEGSKEESDKLMIKHKCINGKTLILPKYLFIPPSSSGDFMIEGYKNIRHDTAELKYCPFCKNEFNYAKIIYNKIR